MLLKSAIACLLARWVHHGPDHRWWTVQEQDLLRPYCDWLTKTLNTNGHAAAALLKVELADLEWAELYGQAENDELPGPPHPSDEILRLIGEAIERIRRAHDDLWSGIVDAGAENPWLVAAATSTDQQVYVARLPKPTDLEVKRPTIGSLAVDLQHILSAWHLDAPRCVIVEPTLDGCARSGCGHDHEDHLPVFFDCPPDVDIEKATISGECAAPGCEANCQRYIFPKGSSGRLLSVVPTGPEE